MRLEKAIQSGIEIAQAAKEAGNLEDADALETLVKAGKFREEFRASRYNDAIELLSGETKE